MRRVWATTIKLTATTENKDPNRVESCSKSSSILVKKSHCTDTRKDTHTQSV